MFRYKSVNTKQSLSEGSEYSGPISSTLHNNLNTEAELCNFYAAILQKLHQKFQTEYKVICKALYSIKTYREPDKPPRLPDYERNDSRFAYVFSYGIIHSVLMYDRFRDMMAKNPPMLKKIFSKNELNICILGGGPGFEAAAICKFLKKAIAIFMPDTNSRLLVHVTVVDICADWKTIVECLFITLRNDLHPLIEVDFCFVQANLTEEPSPAVKQAIESAYFVILFKFVSEVVDRYRLENVEKMIKGIVDVMSFESCLFFLDTAFGGNFRIVEEIINYNPYTTRFYGILHHCQELKDDTIEKYFFFVQDIFQTLKCTGKTTISCSAWLKDKHMEQNVGSSFLDVEKNQKKEKEKLKKSCKEEGSVEQDIKRLSIPKNPEVEKNQKKEKEKLEKSCKKEGSVEQDIKGLSIPKNPEVEKNQKKEKEKLKKNCKEEGSVEQDIKGLSIQKNPEVKNNQKKKKLTKSCKQKDTVKQDINSTPLPPLPNRFKKLEKEKSQ